MPTTLPFSKVILIGIANAIDLADRFLPKMPSLNCKPMVVSFRAYSMNQIIIILKQRLMIGVKIIKDYVIRMEHENVRRAIIVVRVGMTPSAKACQAEIAGKFQVEVFSEPELLVNIRYHYLVPDHVPLTKEEKKELLDKYTVKEAQLPRILHSEYHLLIFARGPVFHLLTYTIWRTNEVEGLYARIYMGHCIAKELVICY